MIRTQAPRHQCLNPDPHEEHLWARRVSGYKGVPRPEVLLPNLCHHLSHREEVECEEVTYIIIVPEVHS